MSADGGRRSPLDRAAPDVAEILCNDGKTRIKQLPPRDDDEIETKPLASVEMAEYLSNQPLSSVSVRGMPEFPRCHDAEARRRLPIRQHDNGEASAVDPGTALKDLLKLTATAHSACLREPMG